MTKRKILIPILTLIMLFSAVMGFAMMQSPKTASAATWTAYGGTWDGGNPETGTAKATTAEAENWGSRYLMSTSMTSTSYTVQTTVQTASNGSAGVDGTFRDYGIMPVYKDDNNYIVFYFRYQIDGSRRILGHLSANDRANGVNNWLHLLWSDAGNFPAALNKQATDTANAYRAYDSTQATTLKIIRSGSSFTIAFNGTNIYTHSSTTSNGTSQATNIGLYASGWSDGCTFSNFTLTDNGGQGGGTTNPPVTPPVDADWAATGGTWNGGNPETGTVTTTTEAGNWTSRYLRGKKTTTNSYTVSFTVKTATNGSSGTDTIQRDYGIYPTYIDGDNHIVFYFRYESGSNGRMLAHLSKNDRANGQDNWGDVLLWSDAGGFATALGGNRKYDSTQETNIKVMRRNAVYEVYFNDVLLTSYFSTTSNAQKATNYVGMYASGWTDGCTFSNFTETDNTGSSSGVVGGGETGTDTITAISKNFTGNADIWKESGGALVGNNTEWMNNYVVTPAGKTGDYTYTATFKGTGNSADANNKEIQFGFIPWYVDSTNYIAVMLKWDNTANGLVDVHIVNGEDPSSWNDFWVQDYDLNAKTVQASDEITITITKVRDTVKAGTDRYTIYINGEYIRADNYRASVNNAAAASVGFATYNDQLTVSALSVTDYTESAENSGPNEWEGPAGSGGDSGSTGDGGDSGSVGGGGIDDWWGSGDTNAGEDSANKFAMFLVPWGIIILCALCVAPFLIGMAKKLIYKFKK